MDEKNINPYENNSTDNVYKSNEDSVNNSVDADKTVEEQNQPNFTIQPEEPQYFQQEVNFSGEQNSNSTVNVQEKVNFQEPTPSVYSPSAGYYYPPKPQKPKKPKDKRKVPVSALIASCLACAIVSSSGVAGLAYYLVKEEIESGSSTSSGGTTTINVDKSSSNVVSAVAQKVVPSVVGIKTTSQATDFFGFSQDATSEGSGIVYSEDGYIITNYHVIASAVEQSASSEPKIEVYLSEEADKGISAKVVGYNSDYDLALLKINKTGLTAVELGDSDDLNVGDLAVAIGNPGGLEYMSSVSSGIISGLNRTLQLEGTAAMKLIQTDAAINPGNSGGALVNSQGQLVGINSSKISDTDYEGMGFAIPVNTAIGIIKDIIDNKDAKYAYVGVKISTEYTADVLKQYGYPAGAVVESVTEGSPAAQIGLQSSDIITEFDGTEVTSADEYNTARLKHSPGDKVDLTVYRSGQYYSVSLTLGESNN